MKLDSSTSDEPKGGSTAGEATKYLRETAKWIVGGVVATAGAVLAGSSLTNLGSLDPREDCGRLGLAVAGAALGFLSIGWLMAKALDVFKISSVSLERLEKAGQGSEWEWLRKEVESEFGLSAKGEESLTELLKSPRDPPVPSIRAAVPYFYVRSKFETLVWWLPWTVTGAAAGFGLFAWAANPPEPAKPVVKPPAIVVNWP
ncbi:MAG TPA: hypothetical protein VFP12_06335 [Allosphingosinicella sp.]|nr:hypothetical protein [Allosphingosinicella sp.]